MGKLKIWIDYSKCQQPDDCGKCLQVCQPAVFSLVFTDKDYHDPKNWKIVPMFPMLCVFEDKCNFCVNICPESAISIKRKK